MEAKIEVVWSEVKEYWQLPEAGRGKELMNSSRASGGWGGVRESKNLISDFSPLEL